MIALVRDASGIGLLINYLMLVQDAKLLLGINQKKKIMENKDFKDFGAVDFEDHEIEVIEKQTEKDMGELINGYIKR